MIIMFKCRYEIHQDNMDGAFKMVRFLVIFPLATYLMPHNKCMLLSRCKGILIQKVKNLRKSTNDLY